MNERDTQRQQRRNQHEAGARRAKARAEETAQASPWHVTLRMQLRDLAASLQLVWQAGRGQSALASLLALVLAFVPALSLWISKLLLDGVAAAIAGTLGSAAQAFRHLLGLLVVQLGIGMLTDVLSTLQRASNELLGDSLQNHVTRKILHKASGLELQQFEDAEVYDSLSQAYAQVGRRPLGILTQSIGLLQALITLSSVSVLMARLGWSVVPLVLLASVPSAWVSLRFGEQGYRMIRRRATDARMQNYLGYLLSNDAAVKELRLFNVEPYLLARWQHYYQRFRKELVTLIRGRSVWGLAASLGSSLLIALATLSVLWRAAKGLLTVGDFGLFVQGIGQLQRQFSSLLTSVTGIYENLLYMRTLFEFLALPSPDADAGEQWQGTITHIRFEKVSFRYPLTEHDVLRDVSFDIHKGQALALVGKNGAGKTTLVKLLTCLYRPSSGRILLNGMDATRFSPRSIQAQMSSIFQDYTRYQMQVRENIALADSAHTLDTQESQLTTAAQRAGAAEFIATLPKGYHNMLGRWFPGGHNLSGGQWQRIALARLYYRDASVMIFDEPTAALDASAEFAVVEALRQEARDRITVIISHRFSTVRLADHIVVLEDGIIREQGSHTHLLAHEGSYAELFRLQARGYQP